MQHKSSSGRISMPTSNAASNSTPSSPRAALVDEMVYQNVTAATKTLRSGVNIYSRPGSATSSQGSPANSMAGSPGRTGLFNKLAKGRRGSRESQSQSESSEQDHLPVPSVRMRSGFWDSFRPRSKSDSKTRRLRETVAWSGKGDPGWPFPAAGRDEDRVVTRPLFVDTQLANRPPAPSRRTSAPDEAEASRTTTVSDPPDTIEVGQLSGTGANSAACVYSDLFAVEAHLLGGSATNSFITDDAKKEDSVYADFMKVHRCYDLIPASAKLVAFDTKLPVKDAFFALLRNGVKAAPLWDSDECRFVGVLTVTDFIGLLWRCYRSGVSVAQQLQEHRIAAWRDVLAKDGRLKTLLTVDPNESLLKAVGLLRYGKVHMLPVVDRATGNMVHILTYKTILRFLYIYIHDLPAPAFLQRTPKELGIGSWDGVLTVGRRTPVIDALTMFVHERVSALPVLDEDGKVVDIYAKVDVVSLVTEESCVNLEATVQEALQHRPQRFEGVCSCKETDPLDLIIDVLVKAQVRRIVITDNDGRLRGLISLSDVLCYLVLRPDDKPLSPRPAFWDL